MPKKSPFWDMQIEPGLLAIEEGRAYNSVQSDGEVLLVVSPFYFTFDPTNSKETPFLYMFVNTSNPGVIKIYEEDGATNIVESGLVLPIININRNYSDQESNCIVRSGDTVTPGNTLLGIVPIGVTGQQGSGGDSIGDALGSEWPIVCRNDKKYILEFTPEFAPTTIYNDFVFYLKNKEFEFPNPSKGE